MAEEQERTRRCEDGFIVHSASSGGAGSDTGGLMMAPYGIRINGFDSDSGGRLLHRTTCSWTVIDAS